MRLRRLKAIAVKEVLQIWRDPRSLMIALLLPFTQMFMFGYGVNLDLKHIPVCTFDREGSQRSQALAQAFPGFALFYHRAQCQNLPRSSWRRSIAPIAGSPSSSRRISPNA